LVEISSITPARLAAGFADAAATSWPDATRSRSYSGPRSGSAFFSDAFLDVFLLACCQVDQLLFGSKVRT
jgi:hypothetical protein